MGNVVVVVVVLVVVVAIVVRLHRHGEGIIARRGMSVGADLGSLADASRVRVRAVSQVGVDRVRVVLAPEPTGADHDEVPAGADMDFLVSISEGEFGLALLHKWQATDTWLGIVIPAGSHLVRLRSVDDLQHLTLRRVEGE